MCIFYYVYCLILFRFYVSGLSMNFKRSVVILFELIKRCEEEIEILQREMTNYLSYYKNVIVKLEEATKVIQQTPNVSQVPAQHN